MRHTAFHKNAARLAACADALKRAGAAHSRRESLFSLAFLTDRTRIEDPRPIAAALPPGAAVILRDDDDPDREALAADLATISSVYGLLLFIGSDASLARKVGAAGVHLRARDFALGHRHARQGLRVSAACHNERELDAAGRAGANIVFLSPAFPTASHPGAPALGPARFKALAARAPAPVIALGGVTAHNAMRLAESNVAGIGAISAFAS